MTVGPGLEAAVESVLDRHADLVIVGGGPAGLAAVRGYREAGGTGSVMIISAEAWPPYDRPPLTKDYLRGEVGADSLPLVPEDWYAEQAVTLALGATVHTLDREDRVVVTEGGQRIGYRALVLATGSVPTTLPIDGGDLPGIVYVRDRDSADALGRLRGANHRVVVIGSGFIGCEAAASLAGTGTRVTVVSDESTPHERRLGVEAGGEIAGWLVDAGVELRTGNGAAGVARDGAEWTVTLEDGTAIRADAVVAGSGARPRVELAERSGLVIRDGGVAVDASMRTSDPAVWAVGDIASATHGGVDRPLRVEHWGEAEAMGEIAGRGVAGHPGRWDQPPGFWSEIGEHTLKYTAWGDGSDVSRFARTGDGWAVLYGWDDLLVGVLAHDADEIYEQGQSLLSAGTPFDVAARRLFERGSGVA